MSRADEYRKYAEQCLRIAETTASVSDKVLMLHMAQKWRDLADKVEREK